MDTKHNNSQQSTLIPALLISLFGFAIFSFCIRQSLTQNDIKAIFAAKDHFSLSAITLNKTFQFFKLEAFIFKFSNILIHTLNVFLLFLFLKNIKSKKIAVISSTLFAIHPIHLETISIISNRSELLVLFFGLIGCTLICSKSNKVTNLLIANLSFALSTWCGAKGIFFILIGIFLVILKNNKLEGDKKITKKQVSIFAIGLIASIALFDFSVTQNVLKLLEFKKLVNAGAFIGMYLSQILFPLRSISDYNFNQLTPLNSVNNYFYVLLFFATIFTTINFIKNKNKLYIFNLWFLIFFSFSLINYGEKNAYIPSVGFFVLLSSFLAVKIKENTLVPTAIILTLIFSSLSLSRISCWNNDWTLASCEINHRSRSHKVSASYSKQLSQRKRLDLAEFYARKAIEIKPDSLTGMLSLQNILIKKERFSDALGVISSILKVQPNNASVNTNAGWAYLGLKDTSTAKNFFQKALTKNPNFQPAIIGMYALSVGAIDLEQINFWKKKLSPRSLKDERYLYWQQFI